MLYVHVYVHNSETNSRTASVILIVSIQALSKHNAVSVFQEKNGQVLIQYQHCDLWTVKMMKGVVINLALSIQCASR